MVQMLSKTSLSKEEATDFISDISSTEKLMQATMGPKSYVLSLFFDSYSRTVQKSMPKAGIYLADDESNGEVALRSNQRSFGRSGRSSK